MRLTLNGKELSVAKNQYRKIYSEKKENTEEKDKK